MATVINRDAPYSGLSSLMALKGRMGDTELVHMSKPEIRALEATGKVTINPDTGLPEAFGLKNILPVALGIAGGAAGSMVGMPFLGAAAGTGLGSFMGGSSPEQSLFNAALSYGAGTVLGNLTANADPSALSKAVTNVPAGEVVGTAATGPEMLAPSPAQTVFNKDFTTAPSWVGRNILGETPQTFKAGTEISPSQMFEMTGGKMGSISPSEYFSKPSTYLPAAGAAITGGISSALEQPPAAASTPAPTTTAAPQRQRLTGGTPTTPPPDQESALSAALGQSPNPNYMSRYQYAPYAKGGIIYREEGGGLNRDSTSYPYTFTGNYKPTENAALSSPVVTPEETKAAQTPASTSPVKSSVQQTADAVARILGQQIPSQQSQQPSTGGQQSPIAPFSPYKEAASHIPSYLPNYYEPSQSSTFIGMAEGGHFEGKVDGEGDGMSDHVQFDVQGNNPDLAMLSRDEYVLPADVVAMIGNGSSNAGADKIDAFVKGIRQHSFGTSKQQKKIKAAHGGLASLME